MNKEAYCTRAVAIRITTSYNARLPSILRKAANR
jgi:hypothetical protein